MTTKDDTPTQIYVPALRRELVRQHIPACVQFLDPGLPDTATDNAFYHPRRYPLSPEQAARVLGDLLAVGETLGAAAVADSLAVRVIQERSLLSSREKADLDRFASASPVRPETEEDPKIAAQKVLLLVWDLEKRLLEIAALRQELVRAVKPLADNLHGAVDDEMLKELSRILPDTFPDEFETLTAITPAMQPDWRLALSAMAAFLPPEALLVTGHEDLRDALAETGALEPLTEETTARLTMWPDVLRSQLLRAKTPLWKILGHSRKPESSPWLDAAPEILVLPA